MKELRQPSEVILKNGKTLEEVLRLHEKWLNDEEGGEKANLFGEDLSEVDLSYADLYKANLSYSNLSYTNLSYADLSKTNLYKANLSYTNLSYADLSKTNLIDINFDGANLSYSNLSYSNLRHAYLIGVKFYLTNLYKCKGDFVNVKNIGSYNDTIHYFYNIDRVICGCFDGTMKQFEEKVKKSYDEDDKEYKEYMIAIDTLKRLAELY